MLRYKSIEIYTSEAARYRNQPVADAVMTSIRELKIAARCIVTRGIAGSFENGELATGRLEVLSLNMPLRITIVFPAAETDRVVNALDGIIDGGIVALNDLHVFCHRTKNAFFPRQLMVRDVMTTEPKSVTTTTSLNDTVKLLLTSIFTGLPVLDGERRPVGVITQGDLIRKGGLPWRLRLLSESEEKHRQTVLDPLASRQAGDVMSTPAVVIEENQPLFDAVDRMLAKGVKRLPVVDDKNRLSGILSRLDIFRTVMRETPDWDAFRAQEIEVDNVKRVKDIVRRDTHTVSPETTIDEVIRHIDSNDIQRIAVVDADTKLLGVISDRDLLRYFKAGQEGIWHRLAKVKHVFKKDYPREDLQRSFSETTAGAVMTTELITVREETMIEGAIGLMVEKHLKRLPVVDAENRFKGMISRDSLLRIGFKGPG